jgi:hypothetical protein
MDQQVNKFSKAKVYKKVRLFMFSELCLLDPKLSDLIMNKYKTFYD